MRRVIALVVTPLVLVAARVAAQPAPAPTDPSALPAAPPPPPGASVTPTPGQAPPPPSAPPPPGYGYPPPGYGYPPPGYGYPPPGYTFGPQSAAPAPGARRRDAEPQQIWYGWQTLIADGGWLALALMAVESRHSSSDEELGWLAVADYLLGPPIIHWVHGHAGKGFGSLGLRVAGPTILVLSLASCLGNSGSNSDSCGVGVVLGLLAIPAVVAIDAAVLAREDAPAGSREAARPRFTFGVAPVPSRTGVGAAGVLRGAF